MKTNKKNKSKILSKKLLKALKEAEKIENGKIKAKRYNTFEEVLKDID